MRVIPFGTLPAPEGSVHLQSHALFSCLPSPAVLPLSTSLLLVDADGEPCVADVPLVAGLLKVTEVAIV